VRELASYLQSALRDQRISNSAASADMALPCPFLAPVQTPRRLLLARADMLRKIEKGKRVFALIAFKKR
jgi:hypothetical protein